MERAEARLQAEGGLPDDAELEGLAKEHQRHEKALDAVLGPRRKTHAVKLAREDRPFRREDLEAFQEAGWQIRSAGSVPAIVGKTLAALNPSDDLTRILGPKGEVRAVVIQSVSPFGEDLVRALQEEGYDVSPAPRGMREAKAAVNPGRNEVGQLVTVEDTRKSGHRQDGRMTKTTGRARKAASTSKGTPKAPVRADSGKAKKAARPNPSHPKKAQKAPKRGATMSAAKRKPGRAAHRLNPSEEASLAKVWKAWTGSEPGQSLRLQVEAPHLYGLPSHVVLLGRVVWLATKEGKEIRFGVSGPYMVTDAEARKVWLVSHKGHRFDLEPALIGYLARKPKFGDRATTEYVHAFEGRTHAVMNGQVGALTGGFRITPAGLEG
ncbi:MAG TPA: hypothetical protein VF768_11770 [Holophagaceae bacterium]